MTIKDFLFARTDTHFLWGGDKTKHNMPIIELTGVCVFEKVNTKKTIEKSYATPCVV